MPTKKEELIDSMLNDGKTYDEIATELKVGFSTISKRFRHGYFPNREHRKKSSKKNNTTTTTLPKHVRHHILNPKDLDFLVKLITRATHRRIISQEESILALKILYKN